MLLTRMGTWAGMTWNYRITRREVAGEYAYELREVYYGDGGKLSWTVEPVSPAGDSWQEVGDALAKMGRAVGAPVLDIDTGEWLSLQDLHRERMQNR